MSKTPFTDEFLRLRYPPELAEAGYRFVRASERLARRMLSIPDTGEQVAQHEADVSAHEAAEAKRLAASEARRGGS